MAEAMAFAHALLRSLNSEGNLEGNLECEIRQTDESGNMNVTIQPTNTFAQLREALGRACSSH